MDLLDRYLANVGFLLPFSERGEILAELRDILLSKMEDKEAVLHRPLNPPEREAIMHDFGHPFVVAGRYRKHRQVISETFYPFWLLVMQIGAVVATVSAVIAGLLHGFQHADLGAGIGWGIARGIGQFISLAGVTTLVFLYLDRSGEGQKLIDRWRPSQLPAIALQPKGIGRRRFDRAFQAAGGGVVLLFWTRVAPMPHDYPIDGGRIVHLVAAPLWTMLYWPILVVIVARIADNLGELFQLGSTVQRRAVGLVINLASLGLVVYALAGVGSDFSRAELAAGPFLHVSGLPEHAVTQANYGANLGLAIGLVVAAVVSFCQACAEGFRLVKALRE